MPLTDAQVAALNLLPKHVPALAPGNDSIALGDILRSVEVAGDNVALIASLKTAAVATAVADVSATAVAAASANATDLATAITLVNELKTAYNNAVTELAQLKALVNDLKTRHNTLTNGIDAL